MNRRITKFLIIANYSKKGAVEAANRVLEYIEDKGLEAKISISDEDIKDGLIREDLIKDAECAIVLGGDGTLIRAVHTIRKHPIPMAGVNFGTIGFLTDVDIEDTQNMIDRLIEGDYETEERMLLSGTVRGVMEERMIALNDIVVARSDALRLIALRISLNGQFFDEYEADGVIVSTPTGSTGYNLSAGGPVVNPKTSLLVITPISPFAMAKKSIVFDADDKVEIELMEKRKDQDDGALVSFDGYENIQLQVGDVVDIRRSKHTVTLLRFSDMNFYERLRSKIRN